jgi:hypothetical protein
MVAFAYGFRLSFFSKGVDFGRECEHTASTNKFFHFTVADGLKKLLSHSGLILKDVYPE